MACSTNAKKHVFIHFNGKALNREEEDEDEDDHCLIQQFWSKLTFQNSTKHVPKTTIISFSFVADSSRVCNLRMSRINRTELRKVTDKVSGKHCALILRSRCMFNWVRLQRCLICKVCSNSSLLGHWLRHSSRAGVLNQEIVGSYPAGSRDFYLRFLSIF